MDPRRIAEYLRRPPQYQPQQQYYPNQPVNLDPNAPMTGKEGAVWPSMLYNGLVGGGKDPEIAKEMVGGNMLQGRIPTQPDMQGNPVYVPQGQGLTPEERYQYLMRIPTS
jgi:hypothetical protein